MKKIKEGLINEEIVRRRYGNQAKFCEGQDKVTFANKGGRNRDEEEW